MPDLKNQLHMTVFLSVIKVEGVTRPWWFWFSQAETPTSRCLKCNFCLTPGTGLGQKSDWPWYEWVAATIPFLLILPNIIFYELSIYNEGASKDLKKDRALALSGSKAEILT